MRVLVNCILATQDQLLNNTTQISAAHNTALTTDRRQYTMTKTSNHYNKAYRTMMTNRHISLPAKAVYVYLQSDAGTNTTCSPSRSQICTDLGISTPTLSKYLEELKDNGYITWDNRKGTGRFQNNLYQILK